MTRYEDLKALVQKWREPCPPESMDHSAAIYFQALGKCADELEAALALPEDSKTVNAELRAMELEFADTFARQEVESLCRYELGTGERICVARKDFYEADLARALRYLSLREASGDPMPYKVIRDGDKVRFE